MVAAGRMRFGLAGTGHWARVTHAAALASTPGVELAAVWGRDAQAARSLAGEHGAVAHHGFDAFLAGVDAVAFALPPDVQAGLAVRAAAEGKHLLLEKPIATDEEGAGALTAAVRASGVASAVFFTARFRPAIRAWLAEVTARGGWHGGSALWLSAGLLADNPSPWRIAKGGLWDVGPHAVSLLWAALGPVEQVAAVGGRADLVHLVLHHRGGASSTVTLSQSAPRPAMALEVTVWGEGGRLWMPKGSADAVSTMRVALAELTANARSGTAAHECDAAFGGQIVRVLSAAERQLRGEPSSL